MRNPFWPVIALLASLTTLFGADALPGIDAKWYQVQTRNFTLYSSAPLEDTRRLAICLEQFRQAYSALAGSQAVISVPVLVYGFPDENKFRPFQPLYNGAPKSVAGFFIRGYDENVIALDLEPAEMRSMETIFHEYTHLLMRHNERVWPLWLEEGMAEVYSTFAIENNRVRIGIPKPSRLEYLRGQQLMPLHDLFQIDTKSPEYNEGDQRGIFYAQSWLLTHYLLLGDRPIHRTQFAKFNKLLRDGVPAETAFTEAFQTDLPSMEKELKRYLVQGRCEPMTYAINANGIDKSLVQRWLPQVEVIYQLGNLLLHSHRTDDAVRYFQGAQQIAPESARPYEGLGLAAASRSNFSEAVSLLEKAIARGSINFRAHFEYARALYSDSANRSSRGSSPLSSKMRQALGRSIQLMPSFAPAYYLLGLVEMNEDKDLTQAAQHLNTALRLDSENRAYLLAIAELQIHQRAFGPAQQTLTQLTQPGVEPEIRKQAESVLRKLNDFMKDGGTSRSSR